MAKRPREDFEPISSKIIHLHSDSGEAQPVPEMLCSLPPHRQTLSFASYEEYEVHYLKIHTNRCTECRKNFPTEHFLNLHIEENHDSLVSVRKERGEKVYSCFVEHCDRKCSTPQKRRMHLIDKHLFPKDYDFYMVNYGIDRQSSMLRSGRHRRKSSASHQATSTDERIRHRSSTLESATEVQGTSDGQGELQEMVTDGSKVLTPPNSQDDADMEGLASAMSALKFVPPSVRFGRGRGKGRGGFSRT